MENEQKLQPKLEHKLQPKLAPQPLPAASVKLSSETVKQGAMFLILAATIAYLALPRLFFDPGEVIAAPTQEMERDRALLERNGVAGVFYVRDHAAIDGDYVSINGVANVTLNRAPMPINAPKGDLVLAAGAGKSGCVTVEVQDTLGNYRLCLMNGDPIKTFVR